MSDYEDLLPIAITNDGSVGGVNQFIFNVGVEFGRPILELTFVDELRLLDTLRKAFGASANLWSFLEKVRIAAGGVRRNGLLQAIPKLNKVGILYFVFVRFF